MAWMHRIRLIHKFMILGLIALVMALVPVGLYYAQANRLAEEAHNEVEGTPAVLAVLKVIQFSQIHRGMSAAMLSGNQALEARRPELRDKVNTAITGVDQAFAHQALPSRLVQRWGELKTTWQALEQAVAGKTIETPESTSRHTALITREIQWVEAVGQMDQTTQQNAALVEQIAAAAESLRAQAQNLVHTMGVFKL